MGTAGALRVRHARIAKPAAIVLALAVSLLLALASSAGALVVHTRTGRAISFQPLRGRHVHAHLDELLSNLEYNGGPVMPSNTNYTVYWDPAGAPAYPAGYQQGIDEYLQNLAADSGGTQNVDSVNAQYGDAEGHFAAYESHFGGELIDTDPYPENGCTAARICLDDEQIRAELTRFVAAHKLPTNLETEYFLLTPPGVESCFEQDGSECSAGAPEADAAYCAYHDNIAELGGGELIYANDPYVNGNPGCDDGNHPNGVSDSALEGGLSHEHSESITDPLPDSAWSDYFEEGSEVGDKCRTGSASSEFGEPLGESNGVKWNQVINGHHYWYQQEWSDIGHACRQRLASAGTPPTASFTYKAEAGNEVTFDASASTASPAVFRYDWQFNDEAPGLTARTPVETTAATVKHVFPFGCAYHVALTVFAENGAGAGTAQTLHVGTPAAPVAEAIVETPAPSAGTPVSFFAFVEDPAEVRDTWNFGDGSEASGEEPEHIYREPGRYEVTLTAADACGESVTVRQTVTVAPEAHPEAKTEEKQEEHSVATGPSGGGAASDPSQPAQTSIAAPPAQVSPLPTGAIRLTGTVAVQRAGRASAKLLCTGTAHTCSGEVTLTVRRTRVVAGHRRTRTVELGRFAFAIPSGHITVVHFTLRPVARALLRASRDALRAAAAVRRSVPAPAAASVASVRLVLVHAAR
jgi:PKD repeat protein